MIMFILHFFSNDYYYYFSSKFIMFRHFMLYMFEDTPSVPLCLSSIPFWNVPKYCPVSKIKSY